jgi:hypothetical protein
MRTAQTLVCNFCVKFLTICFCAIVLKIYLTLIAFKSLDCEALLWTIGDDNFINIEMKVTSYGGLQLYLIGHKLLPSSFFSLSAFIYLFTSSKLLIPLSKGYSNTTYDN